MTIGTLDGYNHQTNDVEEDVTLSILVAYDGSNNAERALEYAISMAKAYESKLILLNVQPSLEDYNTPEFLSSDEVKLHQQKLGNEILEKAGTHLKAAEVPYKTIIRTGNPKYEICSLAKERSVQSIVMGSRGMDPVIGKILGSVSYGVLYLAPCPVVVVPGSAD